ncbi:MAG TPA: hypothetical protein VF952_00750 [Chloroflexia bacterium]|jgi:hypothetical protein
MREKLYQVGGHLLRSVERLDGIDEAPFPMFFTPSALHEVLATVGQRPPETGAKGFGPKDQMGFDVVEFDEGGSSRASGGVYSPDVAWGDQRLDYWMSRPKGEIRLWTGDVHSHPGDIGFPSRKSGKGLGDLGYVEEVFSSTEWMQCFFMPIVTQPGQRRSPEGPLICPWVVMRDAPDKPMLARLKIGSIDQFPQRQFNPAWEERLDKTAGRNEPEDTGSDTTSEAGPEAASAKAATQDLLSKASDEQAGNQRFIIVDPKRLWDLLGAEQVEEDESVRGKALIVAIEGLALRIELPLTFPTSPPELLLIETDGARSSIPFRWDAEVRTEPARRLARLCWAAVRWLSEAR